MGSFLVKVRRCAISKRWEHTVHVFADSFLEAERKGKRIAADHFDCNLGDLDAKVFREDAKTVWKSK